MKTKACLPQDILFAVCMGCVLMAISVFEYGRIRLETQRRAIQKNLSHINKSALFYFLETKPETEVISYQDLVASGYVQEPQPVIGEDYSRIEAKKLTDILREDFVLVADPAFLPKNHPLQAERGDKPIQSIF